MINNLENELLSLVAAKADESDLLDYKTEFAPQKKAAFWAETVKDLVAFANTRGGIVVFGVEDDKSLSVVDNSKLFEFDPSDLTNQIRKYTDSDFSDFTITSVEWDGAELPAIIVRPVATPLVFTKVGGYEISDGNQKTAFSKGTVYFRHGANSEPATRADLEGVFQRQLENVRNEWLGNIRKVVEAPFGTTVVVTSTSEADSAVRITDDPTAPTVQIRKLSDSFPYTQKAVISLVNEKLSGAHEINTHDIQCIKLAEEINDSTRPDLMHKPHEKSSPQYAVDFVDLIVGRFENDKGYFKKCRQKWKETHYS
jgi:hypothetical protein